jgi:hypothetical protein
VNAKDLVGRRDLPDLILRSAKRVSKDEWHQRAAWFETALKRLLTMRV